MRELIASILVLGGLAACRTITQDGSSDVPVIGERYACHVDVTCYPEPAHRFDVEPCTPNRADAEDLAVARAGCEGCFCVVQCSGQTPPRICGVPNSTDGGCP